MSALDRPFLWRFKREEASPLSFFAPLLEAFWLVLPALMLAALVLLGITALVTPAHAQSIRYVSPTGSATWAAAVSQSTPASMATANSNVSAGQTVMMLDGAYGTAPNPGVSGAADARVTYVGNISNPNAVIVPGFNLTRSWVTVKGCSLTSSATFRSSNGSTTKQTNDSLAYVRIRGGFAVYGVGNVHAADVRLTGTTRFDTSAEDLHGNHWPTNLIVTDLVRYAGLIPAENYLLLGRRMHDAQLIRCKWSGTTALSGANARGVFIYNTDRLLMTDVRIDADAEVGTESAPLSQNWVMLRDSLRFMVATRCTIYAGLQSQQGRTLYMSAAGSYSGSTNYNTLRDCVFKSWNKPFRFQDIGNGWDIQGCTFASNLDQPLEFEGQDSTIFRHNTVYAANKTAMLNVRYWTGGAASKRSQNIFYAKTDTYSGGTTSCQQNETVWIEQCTGGCSAPTTFESDSNLVWAVNDDSTMWLCNASNAPPRDANSSAVWGLDLRSRWGTPSFADTTWATLDLTPSATGFAVGGYWPDGYAGALSGSTGGVTVTPTSGLVTNEQAGLHPTFSVVLTGAPSADVTIAIASSDATEGSVSPSSLTFTSVNWATPQVVTLTGVDDPVDDGAVPWSVLTGAGVSTDAAYSGIAVSDVSATNLDDDLTCVPSLLITQNDTDTAEDGTEATFTVALSCAPIADVEMGPSSIDATEGVVSFGGDPVFTSANWATPRTVTVVGVDDAVDDGDISFSVRVPLLSSDPAYDGMVEVLKFTNDDDDAAGFNVFPFTGLVTTEAGGTGAFTVRLLSQPTANVVVGLTSSDLTEGTVSPASLTFTTANWASNQTVTVTGVDDGAADGNIGYTIVTAQGSSSDPNYAALDPVNVSVTNADNDNFGIAVAPTAGLVTTEAGGQATFAVSLLSLPTASVSIGISTSDATEGSVLPASLTFTTGNWATPQTVTVTGVDDGATDGDVGYSIVTAAASSADGNYNALNADDVSVTNTDNEVAAPVVASYTYRLQSDGSSLPINKRVAVVMDGRWPSMNVNNVNTARLSMRTTLGGFIEMLSLQGIKVDTYDTDWFERTDGNGGNQRNLALWQTLGSHYALAILPYYTADGSTTRKRWFSADSTTVKLLHIGGTGLSWADSSYGLVERAMASLGSSSFFTSGRIAVTPYGSTDSLWVSKGGLGVRCMTLPSGVTSVLRLFEPIAATVPAVSISGSTDSVYGIAPTAGDSTAEASEFMPLAWRAVWSSGRSVDYLKAAASPNASTDNIGPIALALAGRYLDFAPIVAAHEWDDITDLNPNSQTHMTNAVMDSLVTEFRDVWGIPLTFAINPRHAASYIRGETPAYETAWTGPGWSWMRQHGATWVHHAHDSTHSSPSSNLFGRFGGYSNQNGATDSSGAFGTRWKYQARYASRHDYANANQTQRYGIVQRLQWSDSLRRVVCPECHVPPYLSGPNNEFLPVNWRTRNITANPNWKTYIGDGQTPIDSLMWALHLGLGVPDGQPIWLRAQFETGTGTGSGVLWRPFGDRSPLNIHFSADNDSLVAKSPFTYPDERWTGRVRGRRVEVRNIATAAFDGGAASEYRVSSSRGLARLFGTRNPIMTGGGNATIAGEAFALDPSGIYTAGSEAQRNFSVRQRLRMTYLHPMSNLAEYPFATGPKSNYQVQVFRSGVLRPIRALETLAGRKLVRWVLPWQLDQGRVR